MPNRPDQNRIRVVLVDDHTLFRSGLRAMLEEYDTLEVVGEAGTAHEALQVAMQTRPDLTILDISLPDISGTRLLPLLLEKLPTLKVLVLSMHEDEHYAREMLRSGARGYVLKTATASELYAAILAVHRGGEYIDAALVPKILAAPTYSPATCEDPANLLSPREREIVHYLVRGFSHTQIAEKLCISPRTVHTHRNNIFQKLGLADRADLIRFALDHGLLKHE
jgi:two-component system response regulator NreC